MRYISIKKIIAFSAVALLLTGCHEEVKVKRDNPMVTAESIKTLKKQLVFGGADAKTCATAMSDPEHHDVNAAVCTPWVDKEYQKYKTNIENRNQYLHEKNVVPIRTDFNEPKVWKGLLALWQIEHEQWLKEKKAREERRSKLQFMQFF